MRRVNPKHHINGPSSLKRRKDCPGSGVMEALYPPDIDEEDPKAARGTLLHECAEEVFNGVSYLEPDSFDITPEEFEWLEYAVKEVYRINRLYGGDGVIISEAPYDIYDGSTIVSSGTCDITIIFKHFIIVLDFKFGGYEVEAFQNIQLDAYSLGGMQKHKKKKAIYGIIHPQSSMKPIDTYPVTIEECEIRVLPVIKASTRGKSLILSPNSEACRFCSASHECPAIQKDLPEDMRSDPQVTSENAHILLSQAKHAQTWGEKTEKKIKKMMVNSSISNDHIYLLYNKPKRKLNLTYEQAVDALKDEVIDWTQKAIECPLSLKEIEKLTRKRKRPEEFLEEFITKGTKGTYQLKLRADWDKEKTDEN